MQLEFEDLLQSSRICKQATSERFHAAYFKHTGFRNVEMERPKCVFDVAISLLARNAAP